MWLEKIQHIATLARLRYQPGQLLIISIDGCGGAGKTTFCQALALEIESWAHPQVLKLDDFYHPLTPTQRKKLQPII